MKKYLLLPILLLNLLVSVFSTAPQTYAAALNQPCGINADPLSPDGAGMRDYGACDNPNWACVDENPDSNLENRTVCRDIPIRNCNCISNASDAPGANGWRCAGSNETGYCKVGEVCSNAPDAVVNPVTVPDVRAKFPNQQLKGVECKAAQALATCTCIGQGTVNENQFECTLDSDPSIKGTATCRAQEQCMPGSRDDGVNNIAQNQQGELFGPIYARRAVNMVGIKCARPVADCRCDNPGATGDGRNGFSCTQFNRTERDFCDGGALACTNEPDNILVGGERTERNIFSGAPLKGIDCQPQKIPTPPPPPCMVWSGGAEGQGRCLQFATAVGDLSTTPTDFITRLFAVLLSMSGGIALILIIKAGYQMMVSRGNPEGINAGRDQLVAAIVGLVFLIFSFVILQVIGYDILRLPQLGGGGGPTGGNTREGGACDGAGNNQCAPGLSCVSQGGRGGVCRRSTGAFCDVNGNNQCPAGQTCRADSSGGRSGTCQ